MSELPASGESRADHLQLILEHSEIGAWELDVASGSAWRNPRHDRIFGYDEPLPAWHYEDFLDHVVPEERESVDRLYGAALSRGENWTFECRIDRADGARRWISATGRPIRDGAGETRRLIGHVIDITHTKQSEEQLRAILRELNHRVRNTLSIVQSLAARSFPDGADIRTARASFNGRIQALAEAHSVLTGEQWTSARLPDLIDKALRPYDLGEAIRRDDGPGFRLAAKTAVNLTMTLNELTTNALQHGALSRPGGRVELSWTLPADSPGVCELLWAEVGGPEVAEPTRSGFGRALIGDLMPSEGGGESSIWFDAEGLRCRLRFPGEPDAETPEA